jgi:hypothetical protein
MQATNRARRFSMSIAASCARKLRLYPGKSSRYSGKDTSWWNTVNRFKPPAAVKIDPKSDLGKAFAAAHKKLANRSGTVDQKHDGDEHTPLRPLG